MIKHLYGLPAVADIKNVWRRAGVMIAGRYFSSAEIEERLKGYAAETP